MPDPLTLDFVALDLDPALSCGSAPWRNLIVEGDNFDALRYLRMTHAGRVTRRGFRLPALPAHRAGESSRNRPRASLDGAATHPSRHARRVF